MRWVASGVVRPYAFTTVSELVLMAAMLNMHWVAYDQAIGNIIAEENGLVLTSALVPGLGILVSFALVGGSDFTDTRMIPRQELSPLCFGFLPTILFYGRVRKHLSFGSRDEVVQTLEFLGCDYATITHYQTKHQHIFPSKSIYFLIEST